MKKVFVTGGAGFIGSHLVARLSKKYKVIVYDKLIYANKITKLNKNIEIIKGDVNNYKLIKKYTKNCECIFHLAAILGIDVVAKKHLVKRIFLSIIWHWRQEHNLSVMHYWQQCHLLVKQLSHHNI